ncbi:MAG TPA: hypothetical protein VGZ29_06540 [Terriglobia bacterium]|nr:hypothetical protein [Terriglobia bacterium]
MDPREPKAVGNRGGGVLSQKLESRLAIYVAAAGAAGVGVLALAQPAEAQVIYTPAHVTLRPGGLTYDLDVDHSGTPDFSITDFQIACSAPLCTGGSAGSLHVIPLAGSRGINAVEVKGSAVNYPLALNRGARIGGSKAFFGSCGPGCSGVYELMAFAETRADFGDWVNVVDRYLGFRFTSDGEVHYGWARFSVQIFESNKIKALLTGYAYEATANKPIIAGQTSGTVQNEEDLGQIPAPRPSLGILALGAQGLPLWRKGE